MFSVSCGWILCSAVPLGSVQCRSRSRWSRALVPMHLLAVVAVGVRAVVGFVVAFRCGHSVWVELRLTYISWIIQNTAYGDHLRIGSGAAVSVRPEFWLTYMFWLIYNIVYGDHIGRGSDVVLSCRVEPSYAGVRVCGCEDAICGCAEDVLPLRSQMGQQQCH